MNEEYKSMQDNDVWDLVPLHKGAKPINCKWIFKTKRDLKGDVGDIRRVLLLRALLKRKAMIFIF